MTVVLHLPFRGRWTTQNSPANRVPSHGTTLFGTSHAIDFVAVDPRGRSAPNGWRAIVATESPELFFGFGLPILAPVAGTVLAVLDGETDHEARRSQPALLGYALSQAQRIRRGPGSIAGNHVIVACSAAGPFVLLAHLQRHSVCVEPGQIVRPGDEVGRCGNSGNSTQPHVHVQATDSVEWAIARGLPLLFHRAADADRPWLPRNGETFEC